MYKTIDLFAGAGGLSLGFEQTGKFSMIACAEINPYAVQTYKKNLVKSDSFEFINNVIGYDFDALNKRVGGIDIVIGGPPCQGFSKANRHKSHLISMNNALVKEYFRAIKQIRPKAFVMENVGMLQSETHRYFESESDIEQINKLIASGAEISKRDEIIDVCDAVVGSIDMRAIASDPKEFSSWFIPEPLYHELSVLQKNIKDFKKLNNFLRRKKVALVKMLNEFTGSEINEEAKSKLLINSLNLIKISLMHDISIDKNPALEDVVNIQKSLRNMMEIFQNKIIGDFAILDNSLVYKTRSYSVIDYVSAILDGEYVQIGGILNAADFGVPQERRRYIVIGLRKDIADNANLELPLPCPENTKTTVREALGDLATYTAGYDVNDVGIPYRDDTELSDYAKLMRSGSSEICNHITTNTRETALERFKQIEQGCNFHSLPESQKSTYSNPKRTQNTIYYRLDPNTTSGTVVNVRKSMWIHPDLDRAVTIREAARLQSFPDSFVFVGSKDSQYQQVGNAVPPMLAYNIAKKLLTYLK